MTSIRTAAVVAFLAAAGLCASIATGSASAFFAWKVVDVPHGDTLNVRAWPRDRKSVV